MVKSNPGWFWSVLATQGRYTRVMVEWFTSEHADPSGEAHLAEFIGQEVPLKCIKRDSERDIEQQMVTKLKTALMSWKEDLW